MPKHHKLVYSPLIENVTYIEDLHLVKRKKIKGASNNIKRGFWEPLFILLHLCNVIDSY